MEPRKKPTKWWISAATGIASVQRKHFIWAFILIKSPAVWFPFLYSLIGDTLGLLQMTQEGTIRLTVLGVGVLIVVAIFVLVCNVSLFYDERTNGEVDRLKSDLKEERENSAVLTDLNESAYTICDGKLRTLTDCVAYYLEHPGEVPPKIVSNPNRQLGIIADSLSQKISRLLGFDRQRHQRHSNDSLYTSIIYRFPQEGAQNWTFATPQRGLPITELLKHEGDRQSTFSYLTGNKGHIVFRNSKQVAYDKGHYIPDDEDGFDQDGKLKGSIACFQHKIMGHDKVIADFVITITTYNRKFVEEKSGIDVSDTIRVMTENIDDVFMPDFIIRTKIELCLLYLQQLFEERTSDSPHIIS